MDKEEKDLLLRDLCARLPYDVIVVDHYGFVVLFTWKQMKDFEDGYISKPFLRPMSSMTEEEENEWHGLNIDPLFEAVGEQHTRIEDLMLRAKSQYNPVDWLNAHHFDYRGLISIGLAIEVTSENNPYKE